MISAAIGLTVIMVFLLMGMPVSLTFVMMGIIGMSSLVGFNATASSLGTSYIAFMGRFLFSAMPMFFFMGQLGYNSGLMTDLFEAGRAWLGRLRGGLALTVVAVCAAYGTCTSLAVASCLVVGRAAMPAMKKAGYSDSLSAGVVAGASTLSNIIPPCGGVISYALLTGESIGKLLLACWFPGLLAAVVYAILVAIWARNAPMDTVTYTWGQKLRSTKYVAIVVITVFALMGGLYFGWTTATEAGAIGAMVTFLVAVAARKMNRHILWRSIRATIVNMGALQIIIVGGNFFSQFLAMAGFNREVENLILAVHAPRVVVFLAMALILLLIGGPLDVGSMNVICIPIMYPIIVTALGYDSVWFAIVYIFFTIIANLTPPYAVTLFAVQTVAPDIPMGTITKGASIFILADLVMIVLLYMFPQIALWLPNTMAGTGG